jgi:hypothetical protein
MLTRADVIRVVDEAAVSYEECWKCLELLTSGAQLEITGIRVVQFQPKLAKALFDLSSLHRALAAEKKSRISQKKRLAPNWFTRRMRFLDTQQTIIERAMLVGRSIGDGFAWFFYQNNRSYLAVHLKEQEQLLMPSGAGGLAELFVAEKVPVIDGYFVIYHGTTSILRLGDVSLIDLSDLMVVKIGDIKTRQLPDGSLETVVLVPFDITSGKLSSTLEPISGYKKIGPIDDLSMKGRDRLIRQLKRIASSQPIARIESNKKVILETQNRVVKFEEFVKSIGPGRCSYCRFGESLLLIGLQIKSKSLYRRLSRGALQNIERRIVGLKNETNAMLLEGRTDNSMIAGSWLFCGDGKLLHKPGMTHVAWWPISSAALKLIFFQEVLVLSLFNPVHLRVALEDAGFEVKVTPPDKLSIVKLIGDDSINIEGIGYYLELIQHYFMSEKEIIEVLSKVESDLVQGRFESSRVELQIEQIFDDSTD